MNDKEVIKEIERIITLHYKTPGSRYAMTLTEISSLLGKRHNALVATGEGGSNED